MSNKTNQKNIFFAYWKTILVILGICYLSFTSSSAFKSSSLTYIDKIIHVLMYLVFTVVIINDFYKKNKTFSSLLFFTTCILLPIFIGGVIEIIQDTFTLTRSGNWFDWLADGVGVLLGYLLAIIWFKRKN